MDRIDFRRISSEAARHRKISVIVEEINRVGVQNILITDCLANKDQNGLFVLKQLHDRYNEDHSLRLKYKLRVLRDVWGQSVHPGDVIEWKAGQRLRGPDGRKYTIRQIKDMNRRGEIRQVEIWHEAMVDEKGCIEVPLQDAAMLLDIRGVHFESGEPLTRMPFSRKDPTEDRYGEEIGTQHFWLYEECPAEVYGNLPEMKQGSKKSK